jgi:hypothetical protein
VVWSYVADNIPADTATDAFAKEPVMTSTGHGQSPTIVSCAEVLLQMDLVHWLLSDNLAPTARPRPGRTAISEKRGIGEPIWPALLFLNRFDLHKHLQIQRNFAPFSEYP